MDDSLADTAQSIENAISDSLGTMLVTRWVAVIETLEEDGTRGIWVPGSDGLQAWDTIGLLDYALTRDRANVAAEFIGDDRK